MRGKANCEVWYSTVPLEHNPSTFWRSASHSPYFLLLNLHHLSHFIHYRYCVWCKLYSHQFHLSCVKFSLFALATSVRKHILGRLVRTMFYNRIRVWLGLHSMDGFIIWTSIWQRIVGCWIHNVGCWLCCNVVGCNIFFFFCFVMYPKRAMIHLMI